jgi:general nucleoside transport system permease protein
MDLTPLVLLVAFGLQKAIPIALAADGELVTEKSGILNIGLYGVMVIGAFTAAAVDVAIGPKAGTFAPVMGLIAAMVIGVFVNLIFAILATKAHVDQVIAGIGINIFAVGITYVLLQKYYAIDGTPLANTLSPLFSITGLSNGLNLNISPLMAAMFIIPVLVYVFFNRTKLGLHIKAVGENPKAAEAAGIDVARTRMIATAIGGALLGMGGAYFTIDFNPSFTPDPTGSVIPAFIALAAVIAGGWKPGYVLGMSVLFGMTVGVQFVAQGHLATSFVFLVLMLPYLATVATLGIASKRLRPPAALALPYKKE